MKNFQISIIVLIAFLLGCQTKIKRKTQEVEVTQEIQMQPSPQKVLHIEVNSVPFPFDIAGYNPYVLWINGKRFRYDKNELIKIVEKVGMDNIPQINPADMHNGDGWQRPHLVKQKQDFPFN